jgi:DNA-binding response OmpR family regulator
MLRVLLIEDDEPLRQALADALGSWYDVYSVAGAQAALELLMDDRPDVIVLDLMMPGMDGVQFMAAYRGRGLTCPVILISASFERRHSWRELGVSAYLQKPFFVGELVDCVRKVTRGGAGGSPAMDGDGVTTIGDPDDLGGSRGLGARRLAAH